MAINWGAASYTLAQYTSGTPAPANSINSAATGSSFFITIISFGPISYTITDNKGNSSGSFVQVNTTSNNTTDGITIASYLLTNGAGGSGHIFSFTPAGGSVQIEVYVCEVTGGATSSLTDTSAGPSFGFQGNPASNPVTTSNANDLILSVFQNNTNPVTTFTPGTGFSTITSSPTDGNILVGRVVSATGTYDPSIGFAPSGGRTQMVTIALKASAAANTNATPSAGTVTASGNQPNSYAATNTVVQTFTARRSGLLEPDCRVITPERTIFIPSRKAA